MMTGFSPSRSSKHAPPESASHEITHMSGSRDKKKAAGAAIHRLRQLKQSIRLPTSPWPNRPRSRTMISAGPSSFASRWVTRHVARTARTNRIENSSAEPICGSAARWIGSLLHPLKRDFTLLNHPHRRSREGGNPGRATSRGPWAPAFAGATPRIIKLKRSCVSARICRRSAGY